MYRNRFINNLFICVLCLILNILLALLARVYKSPFFFDTIFTVTATFLGGLVPGLIVAVLFNPIMTFVLCVIYGIEIAFYDFLYAACGIAIVFITWIFSRKKDTFQTSRTFTFIHLMMIAIVSALASSFVASILDAFIRPLFIKNLGFSPIDNLSTTFETLNLGSFFNFFLPRIPITFVDRLICTVAGYAVYRSLTLIKTRK